MQFSSITIPHSTYRQRFSFRPTAILGHNLTRKALLKIIQPIGQILASVQDSCYSSAEPSYIFWYKKTTVTIFIHAQTLYRVFLS